MAARRPPRWLGWWLRDNGLIRARSRTTGHSPAALLLGGYVGVGALSAGVALALGHDPIACSSWLHARGAASVLMSLGLGVCVGAITIGATRAVVRRAMWARALHEALRPAVIGTGDSMLVALSVASAGGEELLFRGLLVPTVGMLASSCVFGFLHQVRGPGRWGWIAWATLMGLLFALIYEATGSLAGPFVAHVAVNHANLRFLRDHDLSPHRLTRSLGGLLNR